jgi:hypothetical protein
MDLKGGDKGVTSLELVSCLRLLSVQLPVDEDALVEGVFEGRPLGKASGDIDTKVGGQSSSSGRKWIGSLCGGLSRGAEASSDSETPGEL